MNKKMISAMIMMLFVVSIMLSFGSVMAKPTNAVGKNPNLVEAGDWIRLENDGRPLTGWNANGRHVVYVDTTKMGQGAIDAKIAQGWKWSGLGGGGIYLFKEVQPAD